MSVPRGRVLATLVFCLALIAPGVLARAGEFRAGDYAYTDKDGVKVWQLRFAPDPKAPTRFLVSGSVGSIVRVPVSGTYSTTNNRLMARWMPIGVGDGPAFGLADINGEWRSEQNEFAVRYPGGPSIRLTRDESAPDPAKPKIAVKAARIEPAVNGALLKGRVTLAAAGLTAPALVQLELWVTDAERDPGQAYQPTVAAVQFESAGEQEIDLARLPATVPPEAGSVEVRLAATMLEAEPARAEWRTTVPASGLTRAIVLSDFAPDGPPAVLVKDLPKVGWRYRLQSVATASGAKLRADVTETVTVHSVDRPGETLKLPSARYLLPCSADGDTTPVHHLPAADLAPGPYQAVVRVEAGDMQTFNGVVQFFVRAPTRTSSSEDEPASLSGTAVVGARSIKPKGTTTLTVRYGYDAGPDSADVDAVFELIDPKGDTATTLKKRVELRRGTPAEHRFNLTSDVPGPHTVKVSVSGRRCNSWATTATFSVESPAAPPGPKPPADQRGDAASQGTFGLVKKVVGKAPAPGEGPHSTIAGSITQNACSFEIAMKPPYEGVLRVGATFSTPKAVLTPGEVIELTCSGSASETGKDLGASGIGCGWGADGSCEVLEGRKFYIGRASDGKFYPSGQATFKVKIGSGGRIVLTAGQGGMAWGNDAVWNPCEYTYQWNAAPTERAEGGGPGAGGAGRAEEPKGASLTSADPGEDPVQAIRAWLEPAALTLYAGEVSRIVDVHIENFRTNTLDRVEVIFPQRTDDWASLPGQIVVGGGDGSYDPANMGRPAHVDGYFFSARETAPGGDFEIEILVRQKEAGFERLKLMVHVVPKPPRPQDPGSPPGPGTGAQPPAPPPVATGRGWPQGDTSGPPRNFAGRWATNLGAVSLTQRGAAVEGVYAGGIISGTVTGSVLTLRMDERGLSPFAGYGRWVLNASGDEFTGGWTQSPRYAPPVRAWDGRRVTTGGASPHVPDPRGATPSGGVTTPDGRPRDDGPGTTGGAAPGAKAGALDLAPGKLAGNGWNSVGPGGASVKVDGDRLIFDVPKGSDGAAESFAATPLDGDFDISIDYEHTDWKFSDELSLSWSVFLSPVPHTESRELIQVMRTSGDEGRGLGDIVVNASSTAEPRDVPALTDRTGTLRIARTGDTVRVWQKLGAEWRQAASFETGLPKKLHLGFVLERQGEGGAKVSLTPRPTR